MKNTNKLYRKLLIIGLMLLISLPALFAQGQQESANTITFAGSGGYPPFNYMTEDGDIIGFDVDVAAEIADRLDMELKYVATAWDGIVEGLRAKRYDGILGSMGITEEREAVIDFSIPYYYSGPQLIVMKDSGINSVEDLTSEHTLGLVTGTTFENDAKVLGTKVKLYEDDNQTLIELLNGRVDGVLTDRIVGLNAINQLKEGNKLTLVGSVLRSEVMGIGFHEDDDELREQVNAALRDMFADGTMKEISAKWFNGEDITVE
ncbi:ABC transporter substrate-binding protein [Sphaerochaeta halotolerans]|uniref:ABC transporter substrate-binding protein n=1 Tax=Sphaerochaeta halotolerans TaxID=2293840 RepID=UPI001F4582CE|nr:ABC transporter substrate-binding protein [Sphaerochaeta halotolerans]